MPFDRHLEKGFCCCQFCSHLFLLGFCCTNSYPGSAFLDFCTSNSCSELQHRIGTRSFLLCPVRYAITYLLELVPHLIRELHGSTSIKVIAKHSFDCCTICLAQRLISWRQELCYSESIGLWRKLQPWPQCGEVI